MPVPEVSMYFGCKHYEGDIIYKETIQDWAKHGIINRLHLAFSRDGAQVRFSHV